MKDSEKMQARGEPAGEPDKDLQRTGELQDVVDHLPVAVIIAQEGKFVYANETFRSMVTVSEPELSSKSFVDFIHPEDRMNVMQDYAGILAGEKKDAGTEFRTLTAEGKTRWYDCVPRSIQWHGSPAVMTTLNEITDRKETEDSLDKSESRYDLLVDKVPVGIYELDLHTQKLLSVNDFVCRTLGYSRDELLAFDAINLVYEEDRPAAVERMAKMVTGQEVNETSEFRLRTKEGALIWVLFNTTVIREHGQPARVTVVAYDITMYKRAEENLQKIEKLESLGVLAGGIAHDFNNILTAILGSISMALRPDTSPEEKGPLLEQAQQACFQAMNLTKQLLTFSEGGIPIRQPVSVTGLVEECVGFTLSGSSAKADVTIPPDVWAVDADAGQIGQVLNNLVINASQAMPGGGIISIETENEEVSGDSGLQLAPGSYVRFSVRDQGVGIQQEHCSRIFDPYFTTKSTGSGLGLATAYSIIKRHRGHIEVESTEEKGSSFVFYLPALPDRTPSEAEKTGDIKGGNGNVLLMDDDDAVRQVGCQMLEHLGFSVTCTHDGADAVERYAEALQKGTTFDLVILDLTVPGGTGGMEAMRELLKLDPEVRAIVSSGYSNDPVMADAGSFGFLGVLKKPFTVEQLDSLISRLNIVRDD